MTEPQVTLSLAGPVATVALDNPRRRNAMTLDMYLQVPQIIAQVVADPRARVVVLRGGGDTAFSAGGDLTEFTTVRAPGESARRYNEAVLAAERSIERCPLPVIAAIQGSCVGGGCGLALAADVRIADPTAVFAVPAARLGLVFGLESVRRLVDTVGRAHAAGILFEAASIDATEALRIGLVNEVRVSGFDQRVDDLARTVALLSSTSIQGAKRFLSAISTGQRVDDDVSVSIRAQSFSGADYHEGVRAFLERRAPQFD